MRNIRIYRWFLLFSMAWLCGCAHLEKSIGDNLRAAEQLAQRCESFDQDMPAISAKQLLDRIKKRLSLACEAEGAACPFGLKAELEKTHTWFGNLAAPKEVTDAVAGFSARLAEFDQSVNTFVSDQKLLEDITARWQEVQQACRSAPNPYQCNLSLNTLVSTLSSAATKVKANGKLVAVDLGASRSAWKTVQLAVKNSRADLTATGRQAVHQIDLALEATDHSLHAIRDVAIEEFRADFFDRLLPTLTAEKVLDFTERQMEPVDRLVDKADQKIYMLGSFAIEASRADIQKRFDSFYLNYLREKFPSTQSAVAFARAACVRLGKPTPAGKSASLIMPFVYSTLTLVHLEKNKKQACMRIGEDVIDEAEVALRENSCEEELAAIRLKAASDLADANAPPKPEKGSLEETLTPANPAKSAKSVAAGSKPLTPLTSSQRTYEVCLVSEQAWRRQLATAGDGAAGGAGRQASQQVCAEYMLDAEQKRYSQTASPTPNLVDLQSTALAQALDRIATKVLQMESASGKDLPARAAVVEASSSAQNFCQWLRSAVSTVSCIDRVDASWLELPASFNSGSFESTSLVPALRTLSRAIEAYQPGVVEVLVLGAASAAPVRSTSLKAALAKRRSSSPYRCTGEGGAGAADPSGNRDLATLRADWAARVMAGAVPELKGKLKACPLSSQPESGDQPFDRRIAIKLRWKSDGASAASSAARTGSA